MAGCGQKRRVVGGSLVMQTEQQAVGSRQPVNGSCVEYIEEAAAAAAASAEMQMQITIIGKGSRKKQRC